MRIHQIIQKTRANGPGVRFCIWVQGCSLNCPGCINPETHDPNGGYDLSVAEILDKIALFKDEVDGLSISGGEPLDQPKEILELIFKVKVNYGLSIIMWTGYEKEYVENMPFYNKLSKYVDVLIVGPYIKELHCPKGLKGSSNQEYVFFSSLYTKEDLEKTPIAEIQFGDGDIKITGIDTNYIKRWF